MPIKVALNHVTHYRYDRPVSLSPQVVRLTMGGEPTFVSIDDRDGAEWSTDAMGPTKRALAVEVFHRLREEYAPQGLAHFGQGKWYPGEQLPRRSLNCFWRRDGQPAWNNPALCADEKLASRFLRELAQRLGLDAKYFFPPPTRMPSTTCGARIVSRSMSIRMTRASTRRATIRSTNWRSLSASSPKPERRSHAG